MKHFFFFLFILCQFSVKAADKPEYAVSRMDKDILLNEKSVVRLHKTTLNLREESATLREVKVVTLLQEEHYEKYDYMASFYSVGEKYSEFEVVIYDAAGKELKKYKQKEVNDEAAYDSSLFSDNRVKYVDINEYSYPFTIEFTYEKKVKDTYLVLPRWEISDNPASYVEESSLTINKPSSIGYSIDYRLHDFELETDKVSTEKIQFVAKNIDSFGPEDFGPKQWYQKPHIILSPHFFEIEGYTGSFQDWGSLGDFYYRINEDRYDLNEEFIAPLLETIPEEASDGEKAKLIYEYMQGKTRYVSVQLGIGGWQSFPAEYVEKNSFGDCKALTTYTKSILDYFGVESYPVLINAGRSNDHSYGMEETAYNGFNHVILAVPNETDTLWMECTSQIQPFNFLGSFTMDRRGLMVMPDGKSHLVNTPKTSLEYDNSTKSLQVELNENGSAIIHVDLHSNGLVAENLYQASIYLNEEDFRDELDDILDLPNSTLIDYELKKREGMSIHLTASFESKNVANKTGTRLFLYPLQFQSKFSMPDDVEDRKHPMILPFSFQNDTEITYILPENFSLENAETDAETLIENFGAYSLDFEVEETQLKVVTSYKRTGGVYTPETAKSYASFAEKLNESLNRVVVFKKN